MHLLLLHLCHIRDHLARLVLFRLVEVVYVQMYSSEAYEESVFSIVTVFPTAILNEV